MPGLAALKRLDRNINNLGGVIYIDLFNESDLNAAVLDFPTEAQVSTGEILTAAFTAALAGGNAAVRLTLDIESTKITSQSSGDFSSMVYEHGFEGRINGDTLAQHVALQKLLNTPVLAVAVYPDGGRKLLGTLQKPLIVTSEFDSGMKAADGKGRKIIGKQQGTCAFDAPRLATGVTYTVTA
jgi:hypothetical protein